MKRKLTKKEIQLAKSIFKNSINYDKVTISEKRWLIKKLAIAPFGSIEFETSVYYKDFGAIGVPIRNITT